MLQFRRKVTTLLDLATDPQLKSGEWYMKFVDQQGPFLYPFESHCRELDYEDPIWQEEVVIFSMDLRGVVLVRKKNHSKDGAIVTLIHESAAAEYINVQ